MILDNSCRLFTSDFWARIYSFYRKSTLLASERSSSSTFLRFLFLSSSSWPFPMNYLKNLGNYFYSWITCIIIQSYLLYNKMLIASNKDHLSRSTYIAAKGTTTVAVTRLDGIAASEAEWSEPSWLFLTGLLVILLTCFSVVSARAQFLLASNRSVSK